MNEIKFKKVRDPHGHMSNFFKTQIIYDSRVYETSEHLYQSLKHVGTDHEKAVATANTAWAAMGLGRSSPSTMRPDWEQVKDDVMRVVVCLKYAQNHELARQLVDTGDAVLIEHGFHDKYWADGGDGSGRNMLGLILMETREIMKADFEWAQKEEGGFRPSAYYAYVVAQRCGVTVAPCVP